MSLQIIYNWVLSHFRWERRDQASNHVVSYFSMWSITCYWIWLQNRYFLNTTDQKRPSLETQIETNPLFIIRGWTVTNKFNSFSHLQNTKNKKSHEFLNIWCLCCFHLLCILIFIVISCFPITSYFEKKIY